MIEIKKVEDLTLAKQICVENGIKWENTHRVIATVEQGKILNFAVFFYDNEKGTIHAIGGFEEDIMMLDGLCRAILNIMDINGVKQVYLSERHKDLAEFVGFSEKNGVYVLQLEGFFNCKCHNKD